MISMIYESYELFINRLTLVVVCSDVGVCRCHFIRRAPSNEDRKLGSLTSSLTFGSTFDLEPEDSLAGPEC